MRHTLLKNQATNVTSDFLEPGAGLYMLALSGTFDGATVKVQFSADGSTALADLADFTFTAAPEPFHLTVVAGQSVRADLSEAGASTLLSLDLVGG